MNLKSMLGAFLALVLAVGGTAFFAARSAMPSREPEKTKITVPTEKGDVETIYKTSPFELQTPGPRSKAVVDVTHFAFGPMAFGDEQSHDFVFKNEGEGPLRLAKGPRMCKCTMPDVPEQDIKPGESMNIKLTWKPLEPTKDFSKEAVIWTNDPANPKITLSIKGQVFADPALFPTQFAIGDIPWDKEHESEITLASITTADLKIEGVEVSHPEWMSVTTTPINVEEMPPSRPDEPRPMAAFTVKLKVIPNASVGPFAEWVKLKLNTKDGERKIAVAGSRSGPVAIHGADYQSALSLLDLKRFKSSEGHMAKVFLFMVPFGEDFQIKEIVSESKHLTATILKESSPGAKKDRYVLSIQATKGITPGTTYTVENPDTLTLKTNHPQVPELIFNARYIVQ